MATYNTVNGQQTESTMESQLRAAGWQGGENVADAYARTTGGAVTPQSATTPTSPTKPTGPTDNLDALRNYFSQTSGFSIKELEEKKREFDATLTEGQRQFNDTQAERIRQFNASTGLDYLKFASTLSGPESVFQQADFFRGARSQGQVPTFIDALLKGVNLPGFTGAGTTPPAPQTAGTLASQLTGQPAAGAATSAPTTAAGAAIPQGTIQPATGEGTGFNSVGAPISAGSRGVAYAHHGRVVQETRNPDGTVSYADLGAAPAGTADYTPVTSLAAPAAPAAGAANTGLGTDAAGYSYDQALQAIGSIFKAGPTSLAPGTLERLDPNELAILKSGIAKTGGDPEAWLRSYQRAGVGQAAAGVF